MNKIYGIRGIIEFGYRYVSGKNRLDYIADGYEEEYYYYTYDDNGNVTSDELREIAFIIYDIDNLPVTVYKTDEEQQYSYDVSGNRVRKYVVGGTDNYYVSDYDGRTAAVLNAPSGSDFTYNIWGLDNIGQARVINSAETRYYYLKDHLGSIRMTVNTTGGVLSYDDYYPFGAIMPNRSQVSSPDARFKFTAKERDTETGYDYFGARYYDSKIGRWLQVDPLADKYPGWSPYNYGLNNPINIIDPNGMEVYSDNEEYLTKLAQRINELYKQKYEIDYDVVTVNEGENGNFNLSAIENSEFDWGEDDFSSALFDVVTSEDITFEVKFSDEYSGVDAENIPVDSPKRRMSEWGGGKSDFTKKGGTIWISKTEADIARTNNYGGGFLHEAVGHGHPAGGGNAMRVEFHYFNWGKLPAGHGGYGQTTWKVYPIWKRTNLWKSN